MLLRRVLVRAGGRSRMIRVEESRGGDIENLDATLAL